MVVPVQILQIILIQPIQKMNSFQETVIVCALNHNLHIKYSLCDFVISLLSCLTDR